MIGMGAELMIIQLRDPMMKAFLALLQAYSGQRTIVAD
jgi:hypothetical protein